MHTQKFRGLIEKVIKKPEEVHGNVTGFAKGYDEVVVAFEDGRWLCLKAEVEYDGEVVLHISFYLPGDDALLAQAGLVTREELSAEQMAAFAHRKEAHEVAERQQYERLKAKFKGEEG